MLTPQQVRTVLEELAPTQDKVDLAVNVAVGIAHPTRVILFGSWARGESRWNSDVDLAVLLPDSAEPGIGEIRRKLRRKLDEIPMTIDLVVATEGFAENLRTSVNSIYHQIFRDGQVAYERRAG
jgi:predicted nucleotidyltransferase